MLMRLLTGLSIVALVSTFFPYVPEQVWFFGKIVIFVTILYRIYDYIAVQHWEWVLPFFIMLIVINPFFAIPYDNLKYGTYLMYSVRIIATIFLGYSYRHIS